MDRDYDACVNCGMRLGTPPHHVVENHMQGEPCEIEHVYLYQGVKMPVTLRRDGPTLYTWTRGKT